MLGTVLSKKWPLLLLVVLIIPAGFLIAAAPAAKIWFTDGNSNIDSSTDYLGTSDANALVVKTNATTAFTVETDQSVNFEDDIAVDGSIAVGGTVDGVDIAGLEAEVAAHIGDDGESVAIQLHRGSGGGQFLVPAGKKLVIDHVLFNATWAGSGDPMRLIIQHSVNPSGPVWNTNFDTSSAFNPLDTPLTIPEGRAVLAPFDDNILHKVFLHGRLVDVD